MAEILMAFAWDLRDGTYGGMVDIVDK